MGPHTTRDRGLPGMLPQMAGGGGYAARGWRDPAASRARRPSLRRRRPNEARWSLARDALLRRDVRRASAWTLFTPDRAGLRSAAWASWPARWKRGISRERMLFRPRVQRPPPQGRRTTAGCDSLLCGTPSCHGNPGLASARYLFLGKEQSIRRRVDRVRATGRCDSGTRQRRNVERTGGRDSPASTWLGQIHERDTRAFVARAPSSDTEGPMTIDSVLLVAFGGPTQPAEIRPFLDIVTRDRRIPAERLEEVAHHYERMPGRRSPLNELTQAQAEGLRRALRAHGHPLPGVVGMRNWHPFLHRTPAHLTPRGPRRALAIILSTFRTEASWERYSADVSAPRARTPAAT